MVRPQSENAPYLEGRAPGPRAGRLATVRETVLPAQSVGLQGPGQEGQLCLPGLPASLHSRMCCRHSRAKPSSAWAALIHHAPEG